MSDDYFATSGSLKMKGVQYNGIQKKKKKKNKKMQMEAVFTKEVTDSRAEEQPKALEKLKTPTEQRFIERRRILEADRILHKANKTHKEKVEDFNRHLDSLTEHFDIPKVSWTK